MKTLTEKQYAKLSRVEVKANIAAWKVKDWDKVNKRIENYRTKWTSLCADLGILDCDTVRYKVSNGKDFSHGYNFTDVLA